MWVYHIHSPFAQTFCTHKLPRTQSCISYIGKQTLVWYRIDYTWLYIKYLLNSFWHLVSPLASRYQRRSNVFLVFAAYVTMHWFLGLNIKVIGSDVHISVIDKRDDFGFSIPLLSGNVSRLQSCGVYISQLVRFARCCTSVRISILKIFKLLPNY